MGLQRTELRVRICFRYRKFRKKVWFGSDEGSERVNLRSEAI